MGCGFMEERLYMRSFPLYDRRLWLLAASCLLALVLGCLALPVDWALRAVMGGGYWFSFCTLGLWIWVIWDWIAHASNGFGLRRALPLAPMALVLCVGLVWQAQETHGFKVLADESLLLGTSQGLHMDRQVGYPVRATDVQGPFQILQAVLDKRPFFYPFLVSLVHDLTGYRSTNPFWLNTLLSFVFLGGLYAVGCKVGGKKEGGVLLVLLAGGLPLLAQQATGGGFELLNLTLATGWWWLVMRYLESPDNRSQDALVLTSVLLASTRYESVLFLVPTALVLALAWWREGRVVFRWPTWVAPLLLLPMFWLNRAFSANHRLWEMQSLGADSPFALKYFTSNLGHALAYFFSFDGYQPNSPFLAFLGLLALPIFFLWGQRVLRACASADGTELGLVVGALGPLAVTGLMMIYFWGQFDHPVIHRLSLPTQLLMLVAIAAVTGKVLKLPQRGWSWLLALAIISLACWSLPVMAKNAYGRDYSPGVAMAWRREFLAQRPERDFLMLDRDSTFWITERVAATPVLQAMERKTGLIFHLRNHSFSAMYVFQTFDVEPETGVLKILPEDDLGPDFELEPITEKRVQTLRLSRFSRIVSIREGGEVVSRQDFIRPVPQGVMKPSEQEAAKRAYLDRWVKELP